MPPTPARAPDAEVWESLTHLTDQARVAHAKGQDLLYAHLHRQVNGLLDAWELERDMALDPAELPDRLTIPGAA